jgi:hypothetical protein
VKVAKLNARPVKTIMPVMSVQIFSIHSEIGLETSVWQVALMGINHKTYYF